MDAPFGLEPVAYAQTVVSYLTADEAATGSLLVIYTDEDTAENPRPHSGHVEVLRTELERAGMPLKDAWLVTSELWRNYLHRPALGQIHDVLGRWPFTCRGLLRRLVWGVGPFR